MPAPAPKASRSPSAEARRVLVAPLAVFIATLLVLWTLLVLAMRNFETIDPAIRQLVPLVLWAGAILVFLRWQRIAAPIDWLGLGKPALRTFVIAVAAFAVVLAWNFIRVSLARSPGGLLGELPWPVYIWLISGVFLNEVLLRGLVLTRLSQAFDPAIAIAVTAVIGLLFRIPAFFTTTVPMPIDPLVLFGVLVFGSIAGLLRYYTRSLWPALALQWANSLGSLL